MNASPFERRQKLKFTLAVLAFALAVCAILGTVLFYMGRSHPRF
jgi:hypothetical protein